MMKRRTKSVSFDAMVKFFMHNYGIPTKKDIDKLLKRLDRLEKSIKTAAGTRARRAPRGTEREAGASPASASDAVLDIVRNHKEGIGFNELQSATGFGEKKLRNIIFRLNKIQKITRKSRGTYIAA